MRQSALMMVLGVLSLTLPDFATAQQGWGGYPGATKRPLFRPIETGSYRQADGRGWRPRVVMQGRSIGRNNNVQGTFARNWGTRYEPLLEVPPADDRDAAVVAYPRVVFRPMWHSPRSHVGQPRRSQRMPATIYVHGQFRPQPHRKKLSYEARQAAASFTARPPVAYPSYAYRRGW